jgi:hypothetical protein
MLGVLYCDDRHSNDDGGPFPCGRLDLHRGPDKGRTLLHPEQPESLRRRTAVARIKPHTVVFDDERHVIGPPLQDHIDIFSSGVFGDVVEGFLGNAIQSRLELRCQ